MTVTLKAAYLKKNFKRALLAVLMVALFSSCSKKINDALISAHAQTDVSDSRDSLQLNFLGTTCFWMGYRGEAVLTDPFISNPPLRKVLFGKIRPDTAIVDDFVSKENLAKVSVITVGHAHYDHLLDLPYMQQSIPASAAIIGSPTAHHLVAASQPAQQKVIANDFAATATTEGKWIYSSSKNIRVMPVVSDHPPHFMNITLYGGSYSEDLKSVPDKSRKWKMGEPFAYLIDFMDSDGSIAYRVWMQSSGAEYPKGFVPASMLKNRSVDAAMVSVATDVNPASYPDKIIELLQPKTVFMIHWENFWRDKYKPLKTVQKGNPERLYQHLKKKFANTSRIILPKPGGKFVLR